MDDQTNVEENRLAGMTMDELLRLAAVTDWDQLPVMVEIRRRLERLVKVEAALQALVDSGILGGSDHPIKYCRCGKCVIRRLVADGAALEDR